MELEREYATFRAKLPELLKKDAGRYVLIHGDDVIGTFETQEQAVVAGWERWIFEPFLVTKIEIEQEPLWLSNHPPPSEALVRSVTALEREMATYRAKLPELLEKHPGRYVLIHGDDVIGVWDTKEQALNEGLERWLFEPYLVKQIVAYDKPIFMG
jgi:hypothetical protein